ncbi:MULTISPECIES: nucleoside triphosphate pyrophosphohydrolase [unclassified Paenibacillus]|uniref:nucleoside triphosphate pyrophosphohydrolase n=1 Tax=unclassified Paenibacillus TaxID=185978 RepID=UPI00383504C9
MKEYNKLVRDKIPVIIEASGKKAEMRVLDDAEYKKMLDVKLQEELYEYITAVEEKDQVAELADLVEVVYAILDNKGISIEEFELVRLEKKKKRGGFGEKFLLVKVE